MHTKIKGLILHRKPYKNLDLLVYFISESGKVNTGIGKNFYHSQKRLVGCLEPGCLSHIEAYTKNTKISIIECSLIENLFRDILFFYFSEITLNLLKVGDQDKRIYNLIYGSMKNITEENRMEIKKFFEIKILLYSGFMPNLDMCYNCGKDISKEDSFIDYKNSSILCRECSNERHKKLSIPEKNAIKRIMSKKFSELNKEDFKLINSDIFQNIIESIIKKPIKSKKLIHLDIKNQRFLIPR